MEKPRRKWENNMKKKVWRYLNLWHHNAHAEEQTSLNFRERQRWRQGGRQRERKFEWAQWDKNKDKSPSVGLNDCGGLCMPQFGEHVGCGMDT